MIERANKAEPARPAQPESKIEPPADSGRTGVRYALFAVLIVACLAAAAAALRLGRRLPPSVNQIELPSAAGTEPHGDYLPVAAATDL